MKGIAPLFVVLLIAVAVAVPTYFFLSQPQTLSVSLMNTAAGGAEFKEPILQPVKGIPSGTNWDVQWSDSKPKWFPYDNVPDDLGSYLSGGCWLVAVQNLDGNDVQAQLEPIIEGANFDNTKVDMTKLEKLEMTTQTVEHPAKTETKCEQKELENKSIANECTVNVIEDAWSEDTDVQAWIPYSSTVETKTMARSKANFGYDVLPAKGSEDDGATKDGTAYYHLCYKLPFDMERNYKLGVMLNGVEYHPLVNTSFAYQLNFSTYNPNDAELYGHTQKYTITAAHLPADCKGQLYDSTNMDFIKYRINATGAGSCTLTINQTIHANSSANWTFVYGDSGGVSYTDTDVMGYKPAYSIITEDFNGENWNSNYAWHVEGNGNANSMKLIDGALETAGDVSLKWSNNENGSTAMIPNGQTGDGWKLRYRLSNTGGGDYGGLLMKNDTVAQMCWPVFRLSGGDYNMMFSPPAPGWADLGISGAAGWLEGTVTLNSTDQYLNNYYSAYQYTQASVTAYKLINAIYLRPDVDTPKAFTYDYIYLGEPVVLTPLIGTEEAGEAAKSINVGINVPSNGNSYSAGTSIASNTSTSSVGYESYQCYRRVNGGAETDIGIIANTTTLMYSYTAAPAGVGSLNVTCVNSTTVSSNVTTYNIIAGLVPSFFKGNGTALVNWQLDVANATAIYTSAITNNGQFLNYTLLPQGAVTLTFYAAGMVNATKSTILNDSTYATVSATSWLYDNFYALDTDGGNVTAFSIYMTNGTNVATLTTSTGTVTAAHNAIPWGNVNSTITASGYGMTTHTFSAVTSSTVLNYTYTMPIAGILVNTYNEKTGAQIYFNITIANSTNSNSWTDQLMFNKNWSVVPSGDVKVTITSVNGTNYYGRDYYVNLNTAASATINAYLLPITDGMIVRFHMMTTTGNSVSGAQITASKFMNTSWNSVGQAYSDNSGVAPLYLDPTTSYQFVVVYSGATVQQWTITPVQQDYYVYLTTSTGSNFSSQFNGIYMKLEPASRMMNNTGVQHINLTLSNNINNFTVWGWLITYTNGTRFVNENRTDPYGGVLNFSMDMKGLSGYLNVTYYYNTNAWNISSTPPESYFEYRYEHIYPIWGVNPHTNNTIQGLFNSIKEYTSSGGTSGTPIGALGFGVAMIMMAAVGAGAVSSRFGMGGGGIFVLGILGFGTYVMSEIYPSGAITWTGIMIITTLATISAMWFRMRG